MRTKNLSLSVEPPADASIRLGVRSRSATPRASTLHPVVGNASQFGRSQFEFSRVTEIEHGEAFDIDRFGRPSKGDRAATGREAGAGTGWPPTPTGEAVK